VPAGSRLLLLNPMGTDDGGKEVPLEAVRKNVLGFTQVISEVFAMHPVCTVLV
jgi:hypothetical protein